PCKTCSGRGEIRQVRPTFIIQMVETVACPDCKGRGQTIEKVCKACTGSGLQHKGISKKVSIPAGVNTGMQIRLPGEGGPGKNGGPNGHLFLVISVEPHPLFEREEDNLKLRYPIATKFAEQGGTLKIPSIQKGNFHSLRIPAHTQNMQSFLIKNAGGPKLRGGGRGDLIVIVEIYDPLNVTKEIQKRLSLLHKI
ncbi:MAG: DnaJ C-terminal domain-containing protein, partial [Anaerolineales bacterium]